MDLKNLLAPYPGIRVATTHDNQDILNFYDQKSMDTGRVSLQYRRSPDFFGQLNVRSKDNLVLIYESKVGLVEGVATFSFRQGYINQKIGNIGYLGDLRIGFSRPLLRRWRKCYADIIRNSAQLRELHFSECFITSVIDSNLTAQRALVQNQRTDLRYAPLSSYKMTNIFAKKPFIKTPSSAHFKIIKFELDGGESEIIDFLNRQNIKRQFGHHFDSAELRRWRAAGPELPGGSLYIVKDKNSKIVGVMNLWQTSPHKSTQVIYNSRMLQAASYCHPRLPKSGEIIDFLFMSMFEVDLELAPYERVEISELLFGEAFAQFKRSNCHFLSFCEFSTDEISRVTDNYLCLKTPMTLYSVSVGEQVFKSVYAPGFEMAMA